MNLQLSYSQWGARLERLWTPLYVYGSEDFFNVYLGLSAEVELGCRKEGDELIIRLTSDQIYFVCHPSGETEIEYGFSFGPPPLKEQYEAKSRFALQGVDIFRHNCWLVGCPIEATVHEKVEWMQGGTKEELELWNLKM